MWIRNTEELHDYPDDLRIVARRARKAAVNAAIEVAQLSIGVNLWIIDTSPSAEMLQRYRVVNAKVIEIDPGEEEVLKRLLARNPKTFRRLRLVVHEWYRTQKRK
jgi:alkylation response protein AidB-like acyl-CoA dehydrogenase